MASGPFPSFPSLSDISSALAFREAIRQANRQAFLKPQAALPTATTQFAQVALGSFAGQVSDEQQEWLRLRHAASAALKKRKRMGQTVDDAELKSLPPVGPLLKVRRVHVDGFEVPQIWQQSNRIISASLSQAKHELERLDEEDEEGEESKVASEEEEEEVVEEEDIIDELEEEEGEEEEEEEENNLEEENDLEEREDEEEDDDIIPQEFVEDENGLNDGFFDIEEFNKKSQYFEDQDARADPNTDVGDDDDEFDWHADPFSAPKPKGKYKKGRKARDEEEEEAEEEEDDDEAPLFGDMDINAPWGDSDKEDGEEHDGGLESGLIMDLGGEDLYYKDFFAPPAKKRREDDGRAGGRGGRPGAAEEKALQPDEQDVRRAMADVKRDLFEQISDGEADEDDEEGDEEPDGRQRSAHERRQAKILAEIRRLEHEAVQGKEWVMSGEAGASARPVNSLLEQDLDFEHTGKPVPVITQEVNEDMEALVKRRILAQEFDEVRRRYATTDSGGERRGLVEIDDQPGKKSLAALYEEEHLKQTNPETYVSASDERLQAEEREVEQLWLEVSAKLDALSSWHYRPRPAAPSLTVVADVGTVAMEDAQPATAQGVSGGASMLAPQEVYKPGAAGNEKEQGVVTVAKSGLPIARDEMTREEKARRRRRNKERIRKSGSGQAEMEPTEPTANGDSDKSRKAKGAAERKSTLETLKKGGVKVIGRRGEVLDLDGNKAQAFRPVPTGNFKL